eukprot:scaffold1222_cov330-Prasinococcus_capsulatus_cf.AAC.10
MQERARPTNKQTDRQTDRQAHKHTARRTDRLTDGQRDFLPISPSADASASANVTVGRVVAPQAAAAAPTA